MTFGFGVAWVLVFGTLGWYIGGKKGQALGGAVISAILGPIGLLITVVSNSDKKGLERRALRQGMKTCPHCAEMVKKEATTCRYCQSSLAKG
jgi:hypothetical protein